MSLLFRLANRTYRMYGVCVSIRIELLLSCTPIEDLTFGQAHERLRGHFGERQQYVTLPLSSAHLRLSVENTNGFPRSVRIFIPQSFVRAPCCADTELGKNSSCDSKALQKVRLTPCIQCSEEWKLTSHSTFRGRAVESPCRVA